MITANQWIVNIINRFALEFKQCGFAYAYDSLAEQHIIELADNETLYTDTFRKIASHELGLFITNFPNSSLLFIDAGNDFPLETPVIYRVQPTVETVWDSYSQIGETVYGVMVNDWKPRQHSIQDIMGSVDYGEEVTQRQTVSIANDSQLAASPNYAMAA